MTEPTTVPLKEPVDSRAREFVQTVARLDAQSRGIVAIATHCVADPVHGTESASRLGAIVDTEHPRRENWCAALGAAVFRHGGPRWGRRVRAMLAADFGKLAAEHQDLLELIVLRVLRAPYTPSKRELERRGLRRPYTSPAIGGAR